MAAPHVSGAVLLLKEAFPYLPGEEIMKALYYSAIDLGPPGEDNLYFTLFQEGSDHFRLGEDQVAALIGY